MLLPEGYEMQKLLQDQPDVTLQEYLSGIQAEIERRKNEARDSYKRKLIVLFQHIKEEGFDVYIYDHGFKKLDIEDIEILGEGDSSRS